jgi:acyl-CoA reductase-like NAD-dependent aldehyde dehydrogenase
VSAEHRNWIAGEWRAAASGLTFEYGRGAERERWPRSNADDVRAAIESCAYAAPRWSAMHREERRRLLARAAHKLEAAHEVAGALAAALGLDDDEFTPRHASEIYHLHENIELLREGEALEGVGVFQAHWSDFVGGLASRLAARLLAGQTALLVADPRLPLAAQAVCAAFEQADLPRGVVALLHDDGDATLQAALSTPGLAWARLRDHEQRLQRLRERSRARADASFAFWPLRNRSHSVPADADIGAQVALVAEQSLGRSATLGGQTPGQIARILCPEKLFSRLCEELLAHLEASPDVRRPVPAIDADLIEYVRGAWALGLDEGATPLIGWESARPGPERTGAGPGPAHATAAIPRLFVNVEARSRLARLRRPAPVLALIRVAGDEAGHELARELDQGAPK